MFADKAGVYPSVSPFTRKHSTRLLKCARGQRSRLYAEASVTKKNVW